jgi:predicted nucleotidyltransferase
MHITFGDSYILDQDQHFELKAEVAEHFEIHPSEVLVVGSGKMGFSIARGKRYRPFCDESDIDVAIISDRLFDKIWEQVFEYWAEAGYWHQEDAFKKYLFRGWVRPDKLPPSDRFEIRRDWWEFFRELTRREAYGPYKVAAGLYKSWHFFEAYQSICVKECRQDLELPA